MFFSSILWVFPQRFLFVLEIRGVNFVKNSRSLHTQSFPLPPAPDFIPGCPVPVVHRGHRCRSTVTRSLCKCGDWVSLYFFYHLGTRPPLFELEAPLYCACIPSSSPSPSLSFFYFFFAKNIEHPK